MFQLGCFQNEILSDLTVALALVPEAVAFAFVAGVDPLVGFYAAFMVGLLAAILVVGLDIDTITVSDLASIEGGLPTFSIFEAPFNLETLMIILPYPIILTAVGLIESLLTLMPLS